MRSQPGLLLGQIASLVPHAATAVSRFISTVARGIPSLLSRFMAVALRGDNYDGRLSGDYDGR
ncbi:MAG TPA: hypothetical protein PK823_14240 [Novosphingobium sp.]|nr:hypothetical protein [Novosphingobium sp.]